MKKKLVSQIILSLFLILFAVGFACFLFWGLFSFVTLFSFVGLLLYIPTILLCCVLPLYTGVNLLIATLRGEEDP